MSLRNLLFSLPLIAACGGDAPAPEPAPEPAPKAKTDAPAAPAPEAAAAAEGDAAAPAEGDAAAPAEGDAAAPAGDAAAGAASYAILCSTCHGASGAGDGVAGAALDPKPANFSDAAFWSSRDDDTVAKAIKEGGGAVGKSLTMAPFGAQLSDEQIANVVAHLRTLSK